MKPLERVTRSIKNGARLHMGENNADQLGLDPIGAGSAFACAVGVHKDLPNIVIKVVRGNGIDGFLNYAEAILEGDLIGDLFPVIHSITYVDNFAVITMERLEELEDHDVSYTNAAKDLRSNLYNGTPICTESEQFTDYCGFYEAIFRLDLHLGNFMLRMDGDEGTVVLLDPIVTRAGEELVEYEYEYSQYESYTQ